MKALHLLLGFLAATAFWPWFVDMGTAPRWAVLAALVPVALLVSPGSSLRRNLPAFAAVVLPLFAAALSIAWTPNPLDGIDEAAHLAILAAAFALGAATEDLSNIWKGIAAGVAISGLMALFQAGGFSPVPQVVAPAGLFMNKNMLAEAGVVGVLVSASFLPLALCLIAVVLGASKAAFGALALAAAIRLHAFRPRVAIGLVAALAVGAAWYLADSPSGAVRIDYWADALAAVTPLGHGLGSFAAYNTDAEFAHSEIVQYAFELGVFSILAVALFAYAMGGKDGGGDQLVRERLVLGAVGGISLFSFPLHMPLTAFAAALAAGRLVGARLLVRGGDSRRAVLAGAGA